MAVKATTVYSHVHHWASRVCVAIAMGSVMCRLSDPIANCLCFAETLLLACHTHFITRMPHPLLPQVTDGVPCCSGGV